MEKRRGKENKEKRCIIIKTLLIQRIMRGAEWPDSVQKTSTGPRETSVLAKIVEREKERDFMYGKRIVGLFHAYACV